MTDRNLVGRCGLYCGACIIYRSYSDSEALRKKIAEDNDCEPEDVKCEGCQSTATDRWNEDDIWGENCKVVRCLDNKGLTYCFECENYSTCELHNKWADIFLKDGEDIKSNLENIKSGNIDAWLIEEKRRWTCDECGKPVSMVLDRCHWCGKKID